MRGGKREGAGRPKGTKLPPDKLQKRRMIRLDDFLWETYKKWGGTKRLRTTLIEWNKNEGSEK